MSRFRYRGWVEGFYGPPWSHEDRLWMLERSGGWGMNRYVYAPKDDPFHRERWREPYPEPTRKEFRELVERGREHGVEVGFALSPGLSITYSDPEDRGALLSKLSDWVELGASLLVLAVDDVPTRLAHAADAEAYESLAEAHVDVTKWLRDALPSQVDLWLVPTEYLGYSACEYLEVLGRGVPAEIEIGWTGRTVLSPTIEVHEARERALSLKRNPWIWDNLPVADGPMRHMLHLAPYLGRDADLHEHVSGILLNPMKHARASAITLYTACAYMREPEAFDPEEAWATAVDELFEGAPAAGQLFAAAHRFAPQNPDDRDRELERIFMEIETLLFEGANIAPAVAELRTAVERRSGAGPQIREHAADRRLVAELEPWLESHEAETRRIQIALDALETLLDPQASAADQVHAYVRMEGRLTRVPPLHGVSYGPRRVLYPQLASMREEDMAFTEDPLLLMNRSLADEIVNFVAELAIFVRGPLAR